MRVTRIAYQLASKVEGLAELQAANPEWQIDRLYEKTGVDKRYVSGPDETALSLGVQAGEKLLADCPREEIDGLIYVTQSPDSLIPTTACLLHQRLGLREACLAFDVNQGCSGFVYGLSIASGLLAAGTLARCLVVCSETYTKYISPHDRACRPIFSDGASAVLVERDATGSIGPFVFVTDGTGAPNLTLVHDEGAETPRLFMDGAKVLLFTMSAIPRAVRVLLDKAKARPEDVNLFVFHQASRVVLDNIQRVLKIDEAKLVRNYQDVGNTVSATIPIALKQAIDDGRVHNGMTVLLMGFGVGYSLAGCLLKF